MLSFFEIIQLRELNGSTNLVYNCWSDVYNHNTYNNSMIDFPVYIYIYICSLGSITPINMWQCILYFCQQELHLQNHNKESELTTKDMTILYDLNFWKNRCIWEHVRQYEIRSGKQLFFEEYNSLIYKHFLLNLIYFKRKLISFYYITDKLIILNFVITLLLGNKWKGIIFDILKFLLRCSSMSSCRVSFIMN